MKFLMLCCLLLSLNVNDVELNYSLDRLVLKIDSGKSLPSHKLIKRSKNLFSNYYVLFSNDIETLKSDLSQNKNILFLCKQKNK